MIENHKLENSITEYYEFAEFELTKLNRDNQNLADYFLNPAMEDQKNRTFRLLRGRNLEYLDWSWLKDPNSKEYKELETRVIWFDYAISANKLVLSQLKEKAKEVILQIDNFVDE